MARQPGAVEPGRLSRIAPTHFGIFTDASWHLTTLARLLDDTERWMEARLPDDPPVEEINARFLEWTLERGRAEGLTPAGQDAYEAANPSWMSGFGMQRYWRKNRG